MIDLLRAAAQRGFRGSIHPHFLLLLIPFLSFASDAFAQFSVEGGRGDRPMGRMERGGGMRDEGVGIGVGIGIEIGKAAAEQAAKDNAKKGKGGGDTSVSTSGPPQRAARKGGGEKPGAGKQNKDDAKKNKEDPPPTPLAQDPKDGIDVPGGKVHRGTGTVSGYQGGDRKGIYCWVHITDKEKCKKFAQYQFVTINFEAKWGNDPKANVNDAVKKLRVDHGGFLPTTDNGNGVTAMPGQVIGDDYAGTRNTDPANLKDDSGNNVKGPNGAEIKGGAQHSRKIPGGGGDQGLIDAPYWPPITIGGLANGLAPDNLRKQTQSQAKQPDESEVGTIMVLQHFRTYVYCVDPKPKTCVGYFDWDYNETFTIVMKWKEFQKKGDVADQTFGDNMSGGGKKKGKGQAEEPEKKTWVPYFEVKGASKVDGPTIGEWKPCP